MTSGNPPVTTAGGTVSGTDADKISNDDCPLSLYGNRVLEDVHGRTFSSLSFVRLGECTLGLTVTRSIVYPIKSHTHTRYPEGTLTLTVEEVEVNSNIDSFTKSRTKGRRHTNINLRSTEISWSNKSVTSTGRHWGWNQQRNR